MWTALYGPLQIDRRIGSADLYPHFLQAGVAAELVDLDYGDVRFLGRGTGDRPVTVGIERKTVPDLVHSLFTARLTGHQLPGMVDQYEFPWLLVEGDLRQNREGHLLAGRSPLLVRGRPFLVSSLHRWLLTLELRAGVRVVHTADTRDTLQWIEALYRWFGSKAWEDHGGHLAMHDAMPDADRALLIAPNLVQKMAAQLPGVGYERAMEVRKAFATPLEMVCADASQWRGIAGIGKILAARIVAALQGGTV